MVTGELGFATTYLLADQIDRNNLPKAPALVFPVAFPSNALTRPVTFTWNHATDKDGDPLNYRLYVWPAGQIPNNNNAEPVSTPGKLSIRLLDGRVVLEWAGTGAQLQSAGRITGPWNLIANAVSPHVVNPNEKSQFYRLRVPESISMTVSNLQSGRAYFWKVITEDDKGGAVESETRRFEVK
jgi:hypothetical protein